MSEELTLHQKLIQIILKLQSPKDKVNTFGDFGYRDVEGILLAVKKTMKELSIEDVLLVTDREVEVIGERYYQVSKVKVTDGKDEICAKAYAMEPASKPKMDESQTSGSAATYAKKMALQDLFMISDEVDVDSLDHSKAPVSHPVLVNGKQLAELNHAVTRFAELRNVSREAVVTEIAHLGHVESLDQLAAENFEPALAQLKEWEQSIVRKTQQQPKKSNINWGQRA